MDEQQMQASQLREQVQESLAPAYKLQRELGGGGMSRVFVAEEVALARMVVIKVLSPNLAEGLSADRFAREIRLAARLQHPHIVPLFSAGEAAGLPYYTMPFVEGESLGARLAREGTLSIASAMQILRDIARALEYAHAHDVVHRDIKPANVLLSGNAASVTDFGIAKALTAARAEAVPADPGETLTQLGFAIGTPAYMSPEQAAGDPTVDHRADLYAFGCLAYEALVGKPPFDNRPYRALLVAHMMEKPVSVASRRSDVPRSLADLIMGCLAKAPSDRPASANEILAAIETGVTSAGFAAAVATATASIAVLPFESMSADRENEYFADGVSEEIINALTQIEGLRVAGRTSSFSFKGTKHDLQTIGESLNVDTVLEGSVRKSGNQLRITVQLVKVSDGYHLWSERYDRELTDVFAVQDEIATAIASKLRLTLGKTEPVKPPTDNLEAYELFLKGRILLYRRGRFISSATRCFEKAVALDPRFAPAQAALADCLSLAGYYGLVPPNEIIERAHDAAERAVALAPDLAEARHALALWMTYYGSDRASAIEEWERALANGQQSTQVRCSYALWRTVFLGEQWDEAVEQARQPVAADPLSGYAHSMLALIKAFARHTHEMVADARRGVELDPESFWSNWVLQRVLHYAGSYDEAIAQARVTLAMSGRHPWSLSELSITFAHMGNPSAADAIYGELVSRSSIERIQPSSVALTAVSAGRLDEAIALCYQAIEERDAYIRWSMFDGRWDGWQPLYSHPGWREVKEKMRAW